MARYDLLRSVRVAWVVVLALLCSAIAWYRPAAEEPPADPAAFTRWAREHARAIAGSARTAPAMTGLLEGARSVVGMSIPPTARVSKRRTSGRRIEIHVSQAMGQAALEQVYELAAATGAVVVFRGVPENATLGDVARRLRDVVSDMSPPPAIELDPTRFRKFGTKSVPRLLLTDGDRLLATASGTTDVAWFEQRLRDGAAGDLGVFGSTTIVVERDLIEVMQERAAAYDFAAAKEQALARFWERARFFELPRAEVDRVRYIDPTVMLREDIRLPDGTPVAAAGTRVNPLEHLPFTQRLIVFDARDPDQVAFAARSASEVEGKRRVTLISTGLDRRDGWASLREVQNRLRGPVYLLPNDLAARLRIKRVPSVVEADGARLRIEEVAVAGRKG